MASPSLPHCASCIRRVTRLGFDAWKPLQQVRSRSKAAREAERSIVVKLLKDIPRFGRAGAYIPINPALMRNRWYPARIADYVPALQLKQLKAQGMEMARDPMYGVQVNLEEAEEEVEDLFHKPKPYVRPIEIELLTPERAMELLDTFISPTIDFSRQPIEYETEDSGRRYGASNAADVLTAAAMASKPKPKENAIYGSVSAADIVGTIKAALAHNDEAARVVLSESDVKFITGHEDEDTSRVKQLGTFKVEITVPGAAGPITRNIRVRAKESSG